MSAKQDVLTRLGAGEGSAGEAVVRFVEETLVSNREELARLADEHNRRVQDFESRVAEFVSTAQLDEVKSDVAGIRRQLAAAAAALGGAVSAHNQAVAAASDTSVEAAQAATAEAEEAGQQAQAGIEELETRVSELEQWRDDRVDPTLTDHEERISALEGRAEPIVLAQPGGDEPAAEEPDPAAPNPVPARVEPEPDYPGPEPEQPAAIEPAPQPQPRPIRQQPVTTRQWLQALDSNPGAKMLAFAGLVLGLILGIVLCVFSSHVLWDGIAFLFVPLTAAIGFIAGGNLGLSRSNGRQAQSPVEA